MPASEGLSFPFHWHTEPFLIASVLFLGWLYSLWIWVIPPGLDQTTKISVYRVVSFYMGLCLAYLAVGSPIDQIGEDFLFSVHMVQHLIVFLPVTLLLIYGIHPHMLDVCLKRHSICRWVLAQFFHPVCAALSFIIIYSIWHIPVLYEAALSDKRIHILEHMLMLMSAIQVWWPLVSSSAYLPAMTPPLKMFYMIILMIGQFPVFGMLTLSQEPLYMTYTLAPKIVPWSPLQDQVLGGVLMNVTMMLAFLTAFGMSFYQWYASDGADIS